MGVSAMIKTAAYKRATGLQVEERRVEDLVPYANNARTHSEEQIGQLVASIEEFGFTNPVLIDKKNGIIAGHGRVLAASRYGLAKVPVIVLKHLTDKQRRAYIIADNKLALNSGWNLTMLAAEVRHLQQDDYNVEMAGFDGYELEELLRHGRLETELDAEPQMERAEELAAQWGVKPGQLWQLGDHLLLCGDCTKEADVAACVAGSVPTLMVTDPPYGVEYDPAWRTGAGLTTNRLKMGAVLNDDRADWREAWALFPGAIAYVYHGGLKGAVVQASLEATGFTLRAQIIWAKDRMALGRGDYHWKHEPCWYAVREGRRSERNKDRTQTTLWTIPSREDSGHGHSTQKPLECMARAIRNHHSEFVYEPFCGSGTTIMACENLGRKCRAIEISPGYVAVALQRWATATGKTPVLLP